MDEAKRKEITVALGELVVTFGNLEDGLRDSLLALSPQPRDGDGTTEVVAILAAGMSFKNLVQAFGATCQEASPERAEAENVASFCGYLDQLNAERNKYVHSGWDFGLHGEPPIRYRRRAHAKKGLVQTVDAMDVAELLDLSNRLEEAGKTLFKMLYGLLGPVEDLDPPASTWQVE